MTEDQWTLVERITAVSREDRPAVGTVLTSLNKFAEAERTAAFVEEQNKRNPYTKTMPKWLWIREVRRH